MPETSLKKPRVLGRKEIFTETRNWVVVGTGARNRETCNQKRDVIKNVTTGCHSNNLRYARRTGTSVKNYHSCGATKHPQKSDINHAQ